MHGRNRSPERPGGNSVFIAGTDTGIGKTLVAAAVLSILRARGVDAVPMKPVQTGCSTRRGSAVAPDLEFCLTAAGLRPGTTERDRMAPYKFQPACSPHLAARLAHRIISPALIARRHAALAARRGFVVIEGTGGVLVPIGSGQTMLDVIRRLAAPVILVARPGLGTINHSLLSLHRLRHAGIEVIGIVFCRAQPGRPGYIERDNSDAIADYGNVKILGSLPFVPDLARLRHSPPAFLRWAEANLRIGSLLPAGRKNEALP